MSTLAEVKQKMSGTSLVKSDMSPATIENVLLGGDLSKLTPQGRVQYYAKVCETVGLNPLTKPFDYIILNGKLTLYAKKDCTQQLCNIHNISTVITKKEIIENVYVVTCQASMKDRKSDDDGAVDISGLKGGNLANAMMKAVTKAKRRAVLGICGLSILDESELDTLPEATPANIEDTVQSAPEPVKAPPAAASAPMTPEDIAFEDDVHPTEDSGFPEPSLADAVVGTSILEFTGLVKSTPVTKTVTIKGKPGEITSYQVEDSNGAEVTIDKFGKAKEGIDEGIIATFFDVKVSEYNGTKKFLAKDIKAKE